MDLYKIFSILFFIIIANLNIAEGSWIAKSEIISFNNVPVFYKPSENKTIDAYPTRPWNPLNYSLKQSSEQPCACFALQCGCCVAIKISQFNIDKTACANLTYDPNIFAIVFDMYMNDKNVSHLVFSAANPPKICIPIPLGPIPISGLDLCVKFFNLSTPEVRNFHICMDWEIRIVSNTLVILHFDCLRFGKDGVVSVKPSANNGGLNVPALMEGTAVTGAYDIVTEMKTVATTDLPDTTKMIDTQTISNDILESTTEFDSDMKIMDTQTLSNDILENTTKLDSDHTIVINTQMLETDIESITELNNNSTKT